MVFLKPWLAFIISFDIYVSLLSLPLLQLGITTLTPAGLLVGAKSIVCHNKQLRTEMKELERELETIQGQNDFMVSCR